MFRYTHFQLVPANTQGRDFILADLHGCYKEFKSALGEVEFDSKVDRVLSVGDLIDRGKESLRCLELLNEEWFFAVQGNHENMMMGGLKAGPGSDPWRGWMQNGGDWYKHLSSDDVRKVKALIPLVAKMPIVAVVETPKGKKIGLSHAQPPRFDWHDIMEGKKLSGDEIWRAMWSREVLRRKLTTPVKGVDITFHGHTIVNRARKIANMNFIDIGFYVNKKVQLIEVTDALFETT